MSGADVKRQVMEALAPDDVDGWSGEKLLAASPALSPCIVLTAEEAAKVVDFIAYLRGDVVPSIDPLFGGAHALALLTPDPKPKPKPWAGTDEIERETGQC